MATKSKTVFVNPFYQEGVGRRTGIQLKKDVRKDSDGFENFDDYWSESENDATLNMTVAEKENLCRAANEVYAKQTQRKKSSLAPMPSFSPQATSAEQEKQSVTEAQDMSEAPEDVTDVTSNEADITGSVIKGPANSLEPSSAVKKFRTRQRLSFSSKESTVPSESGTSVEDYESSEAQATEYDASQEGSTSSEGTVRAPSSVSSQSGSSQEEAPQSEESQSVFETESEPVSSSQDMVKEKEGIPDQAGIRTRRSLKNVPKERMEESRVSEKLVKQRDETSSRMMAKEEVEKQGGRRQSKRQSSRGQSGKEEEKLGEVQEVRKEASVQEKVEEKRRKSEPARNSRQEKKVEDQQKRRSTRAAQKSEQIDLELSSQSSQEMNSRQGKEVMNQQKRRSTRASRKSEQIDLETSSQGSQETNATQEKEVVDHQKRRSTKASKKLEQIDLEVSSQGSQETNATQENQVVDHQKRRSTKTSKKSEQINLEVSSQSIQEKEADGHQKRRSTRASQKSEQTDLEVSSQGSQETNATQENQVVDHQKRQSTKASKKSEQINLEVSSQSSQEKEADGHQKRRSTRASRKSEQTDLEVSSQSSQETNATQEKEVVDHQKRRSTRASRKSDQIDLEVSSQSSQEKEIVDQHKRQSTRASRKSEQIESESSSQSSQENAPEMDAESVSKLQEVHEEESVLEKSEEKRRQSQVARNSRQENKVEDQQKRRSTRASLKTEKIDLEKSSQDSEENSSATDAESVNEQIVADEAEDQKNNSVEEKSEVNAESAQKSREKRRASPAASDTRPDYHGQQEPKISMRRSVLKDADKDMEVVNEDGEDGPALFKERHQEESKVEEVESNSGGSKDSQISDSQNDASNHEINKILPEKEDSPDHSIDDEEGNFLSLKVSKKIPQSFFMDIESDDDLEVLDAESQEWGVNLNELKPVNDKQRRKSVPSKKKERKTEKNKSVHDDEAKAKETKGTKSRATRQEKEKITSSDDERSKGKSRKGSNKHIEAEIVCEEDHNRTFEERDSDSVDALQKKKQEPRRKSSKGGNKKQTSESSDEGNKKKRGKKTSSSTSSSDGSVQNNQSNQSRVTIEQQQDKGKRKISAKSRRKDEANSSSAKHSESEESGSKSKKTRRRSSVHFTTKDMISADGVVSIHRIGSSEEDNIVHKSFAPTPASKPKGKGIRSRGKSVDTDSSMQHPASTNQEYQEMDEVSYQASMKRFSLSDGTSGSDAEVSDDILSKRTQKKGSKGKQPMKRKSSGSSEVEVSDEILSKKTKKKGSKGKQPAKRKSSGSSESVSSAEYDSGPSDPKKRKSRGRRSASPRDVHPAASDNSGAEQGAAPADVDYADLFDNKSLYDRGSVSMYNQRRTPGTSQEEDTPSTSSGSILKTSKNYRSQTTKGKKRFSLFYTENPTHKAYIIPPEDKDGVRRTRRQRIRPLEYWRNERPLYERRKSGGFALAGVMSPEEKIKQEKSKTGKPSRPPKVKGALPTTPSQISFHASPPHGVLPVTNPGIAVINPETQQEVFVDAVTTSDMLQYVGPSGLPATPDDAITMSKAFSQKAFSSGVLTVRPFEEKGSQLVRRDTMVFFVVRGKITITIHQTSHMLQNGDWFFVPKGNVYNIKNLRKDEAKLVFFQLKCV